MGIILSKDPKEIIKILKKNDKVFKVTKDIYYSFPKSMFEGNPSFVDFIKEHPKRMFTDFYRVFEETKEVEII